MSIPILYEDNHLLIVEKPVNVPVQKDSSNDRDVLTIMKEDIKRRYNKPGNVYLALVHRLDRPVGGVLVLAKTSKAASRLADQLRKQEIKRTYLAVVRGKVKQAKKTLRHFLKKDRKRNEVHVVQHHERGAKEAILSYKLVEAHASLSLLEVTLQTGRSHQIRVQLAEIGHPLYGDQKYGSKQNKVGQQIALWANEVSFIHPVKKTEVKITSFPPYKAPWNEWKTLTHNRTEK